MGKPARVQFVVRRILPHEGRALQRLRLSALADAPSAFASSYAAEADREDEFWEDLAQRRATGDAEATFVAESRGELVAIVGGFVETDTSSVHLVSLWTAPAARRKGVAKALIAAMTKWARASGASEIQIWVTCGNDGATRLYESLNFAPTSEYQPLPSDPSKQEQRMRLVLG